MSGFEIDQPKIFSEREIRRMVTEEIASEARFQTQLRAEALRSAMVLPYDGPAPWWRRLFGGLA